MLSKNKLTMILSGVVALVPIAIYLFLYSSMPDTVPIHYDGNMADRFVSKSSFEVILQSGLGCLGFIIMKLLQILLEKAFIQSSNEPSAALSRIWNMAILVVTVVFAGISSYTFIRMV
ncbi:hypothetical protein D3C76_271050 [compost metagenome]